MSTNKHTQREGVKNLRSYKIRRMNGKSRSAYHITVPAHIGRMIEDSEQEVSFDVELTDTGLMYVPIRLVSTAPPEWVRKLGDA